MLSGSEIQVPLFAGCLLEASKQPCGGFAPLVVPATQPWLPLGCPGLFLATAGVGGTGGAQRGWRAQRAAAVGAVNQSSTQASLPVSGGHAGLGTWVAASLMSLFFPTASLSPPAGRGHGTALAAATGLVLPLVRLVKVSVVNFLAVPIQAKSRI